MPHGIHDKPMCAEPAKPEGGKGKQPARRSPRTRTINKRYIDAPEKLPQIASQRRSYAVNEYPTGTVSGSKQPGTASWSSDQSSSSSFILTDLVKASEAVGEACRLAVML